MRLGLDITSAVLSHILTFRDVLRRTGDNGTTNVGVSERSDKLLNIFYGNFKKKIVRQWPSPDD